MNRFIEYLRNTCSVFRFSAFTLIFWSSVNALAQQGLLAQYPLETEGSKVLRLYDVSGRGQHGVLVNYAKDPIAYTFQGASFANNINCIEKVRQNNAFVSIPPLYNANIVKSGFTVSFWIYINNTSASGSETTVTGTPAISLPYFSVYFERNGTEGTRIALHYPTEEGKNEGYFTSNRTLRQTGWHYIGISYAPGSLFSRVAFASYFYDGLNYYDSKDSLKYEDRATADLLSINPKNIWNGMIYNPGFTGKIWNVKFFDVPLDQSFFNNDRNNSWYESKQDFNKGHYQSYYINNALSFYPCSQDAVTKEQQIEDIISGRNSFSVTGLSFVQDRFDKAGNAIAFKREGNVSLPPFYNDYTSLSNGFSSKGIDEMRGYTVSFWTFIDKKLFPPSNGWQPYSDTDFSYQFYYVSNSLGQLAGGELRADKMVINRYALTYPPRPWKLWLWDNVSFRNMIGWYHVVFVQKANAVRVVMFKPDGSEACRLNYFNSESLKTFKDALFGFGLPPTEKGSETVSAAKYLDDVRIYNWPFSIQEAETLHRYELINK